MRTCLPLHLLWLTLGDGAISRGFLQLRTATNKVTILLILKLEVTNIKRTLPDSAVQITDHDHDTLPIPVCCLCACSSF